LRPPEPQFGVTQADLGEFAADWNGRDCLGCHAGTPIFTPPMPEDPAQDTQGTASALTELCKNPRGGPLTSIGPDAGAHNLQLLCVLLPPEPAAGDPCNHGGGSPPNNQPLNAVQSLAQPCFAAIDRYRIEVSAWLDAGVVVDAGCTPSPSSSASSSSLSGSASSSSSSGAVSGVDMWACPRSSLQDEWDALYEMIGERCKHCHTMDSGLVTDNCLLFGSSLDTHVKLCGYAHQSDGTLAANGWQTSKLYLATHDEERASLADDGRFACSCCYRSHESIFTEADGYVETVARAWFDAIFASP
jgi:hypothetical protein